MTLAHTMTKCPKLTVCAAGFEAPGEYGDEESEEEDDGEEDREDGGDDKGDYYGDGDMTRAMEESRRAYYGHGQEAGSSSAYASTYAPATGVDPSNFTVVPSYCYEPGSVFKMLWSEPRGKQSNSKSTVLPTENKWSHEKNFYVGVRRFVIIATDRAHHSTCVPILTYEHRACTKPGVQPGVHGIIYSHGRRPEMKHGEKELGYRPVSCVMNPHEALSKESRVNYSKLVTIEHNVEVQFIGSITQTDFTIVTQAVDDCWRKKSRHSTRESKPKSKSTKPSKSKSSKPPKSKAEPEPRHKSSSSKNPSDKKHSKRTH
ncbi:hypothetical protein PG996_014221 [Apiospora saccharicola]|uniref:DUF6590 domain-containing protein n=1 Tax=Apiospora saccharicola TaxID=335842 RepID=A0ABR1THW3_9PEZI